MLRHARPPRHARPRGPKLAAAARQWLLGPAWRRKKTVVLAGTALALASAGSAAAATAGGSPAAAAGQGHAAAHAASPGRLAGARRARLVAGRRPTRPQARPVTWQQVSALINTQTNPAAARQGQLPPADQLLPVGTSGSQAWMPISGSQLANATTIVQQTLTMRMGVRSAVIAVATAMQESELQDLGYGDGDSLGLFQQQPSDGWGTAQQILDPAYAADAFLASLQRYQASDPGWAGQPLWASAQAVQQSGYPFAYAQWESEAAGLVKQIAMSIYR